jgi:hypothetical protein
MISPLSFSHTLSLSPPPAPHLEDETAERVLSSDVSSLLIIFMSPVTSEGQQEQLHGKVQLILNAGRSP